MDSQFIPPKTHTTFLPKPLSKPVIIAAGLFAIAASLLLAFSQAAGNASLILTPNSGSYDQNTNATLTVYEDSGTENVNAVDVRLTYDAAKLQFVSINTTGSPFDFCTEKSGGSGNVTITCAKLGGGVANKQLVGKVTFKALAGSGSTAVSFGSNSHIVRSSDNTDIWNGNTTGGSYNLTTPATPPPASGSSSSPSSGSSSSPSTPSSSSTPSGDGATSQPSSNTDYSAQSGGSARNPTTTGNDVDQANTFAPQAVGQSSSSPQEASASEQNGMSSLIPIIAIGSLIGILLALGAYFGRSSLSRMFEKDTHNFAAYQPTTSSQPTVTKPTVASANTNKPKVINTNKPYSVEERLKQVSSPNLPTPGAKISPQSK